RQRRRRPHRADPGRAHRHRRRPRPRAERRGGPEGGRNHRRRLPLRRKRRNSDAAAGRCGANGVRRLRTRNRTSFFLAFAFSPDLPPLTHVPQRRACRALRSWRLAQRAAARTWLVAVLAPPFVPPPPMLERAL